MANSESCAACGCQISSSQYVSGKAVKYGAESYCSECAALIIGPQALQAASSGKKNIGSAVRAAQGIEVVEELNISVAEQPQDFQIIEEQSLDLDLAPPARQAQKGSAAPAPDVEFIYQEDVHLEEPAAPEAPEVDMADVELEFGAPAPAPAQPSASGRLRQPSGRHSKASGRQNKTSGRQSSRTSGRQSGRQSSRLQAAVQAPAPAPTRSAGASGRQKVSDRSPAASSSRVSARGRAAGGLSGRNRAAGGDDDRQSQRGKAAAAQGMSTGMMVGLGVGGLFFVLLIGFAMSGGGDKDTKKKATKEEVFDDKTPAAVYAKKAQELEKTDKLKAADFYEKAATQAEREKSPSLAQKYAAHAYQIRKFTTLPLSKGR